MIALVFSSENGFIKTNDKNERGKINKNTELGSRRKKRCKKNKRENSVYISCLHLKVKKQSSKTKLACEKKKKKKNSKKQYANT